MKLNDGTILMHDHAPYDPVKAHEYYIRTRQLKGRRHGRQVTVKSHTRNVGGGKGSTYTVTLSNGHTVQLTRQQLVEEQAYAAHRVAEITTRLHKLTDELKKMLAAAQKRKTDAHKKPTAADKAKAKTKSKQYRQKHKQELKNKAKAKAKKAPAKKTTTHHTLTVAEVEHKITVIKDRLKTAIAVQRSLNTAKQNT